MVDGKVDVGEDLGNDFVRDEIVVMEGGWGFRLGGFGCGFGYMV